MLGITPDEIRDAHLSVAEWLEQRGQQFVAQGEAMLAEAAEIRAKVTPPEPPLVAVPEPPVAEEPVEPPAEVEPPEIEPPPVEDESVVYVEGKDPKPLDGKKGKVTFKDAILTAARMKDFSRREFADELGVSALAVGKFLAPLAERGIVKMEGARYIASPFADKLTFEQRKQAPPDLRTPDHAPEREFPENLRYMPAAQNLGTSLERRIAHAQAQKRVCDFIHGRDTTVSPEICEALGIERSVVNTYLTELEEAGLIARTGVTRHAAGTLVGRPSVEYSAPDAVPTSDEDEPIDRNALAALKKVRDWSVKQSDLFSPIQCATAVELPIEIVTDALLDLVGRGILTDESPAEDMRLFAYSPPTEAGRAAELDARRKRAQQEPPSTNGSGGDPVAGTGKKLGVTNPEVRVLVTAAQKAGANVEHATNGHFCVTWTDEGGKSKRVLIAATPSGGRTVLNDRARLRRAGLAV